MAKNLRLAALVQSCAKGMQPEEILKFRRVLIKRLPEFVTEAAAEAKASAQQAPGAQSGQESDQNND